MERPVFSVSELNNYVRICLENNPALQNVCVIGEISNYKLYPSGHHYFSLKDSEGALSCVMFKGSAFSLRFRPENGMTVMASGKVSVYPRDGKYQLVVSAMMPSGAGDLQLAFEQLKARLDAEGLFDSAHKKPVPPFPDRIAVVTSPAGAAVRDIIRILGSRWPLSSVVVFPVRVQGTEAPGEICEAIEYINSGNLADVIITGRGGGSAEDLWAFNDEKVARAIYASEIPVISAVGHEPDVVISDYVADARASTPSNAAEICVPDISEIRKRLAASERNLSASVDAELSKARNAVGMLAERKVLNDPCEALNMRRMDVDMLRGRLAGAQQRIVDAGHRKLASLSSGLDALSPLKVLARGYALTYGESGECIRSASSVVSGSVLRVKYSDGTVRCTAEEIDYAE